LSFIRDTWASLFLFTAEIAASRSLRLLLALVRELRLDPLGITGDPENLQARRSCERGEANFVETVSVPRRTALFTKPDILRNAATNWTLPGLSPEVTTFQKNNLPQ